MSAKKRPKTGLGRGFESLIPIDLLDESFDPMAGDHSTSELRHIKLTEIAANPSQPRRHFDEAALNELAESIKIHGVLQPIVVVPKNGKYEIVAGERRFRASKIAGLASIPALVRSVSGQHKLELALIENIQRRDLNALETAAAYAKLRNEFNLSLEEIGQRVGGKSVSAISNTLRLLKLPKIVHKAILSGELTEGQARPLVDHDEKQIEKLLPRIIAEKWSARDIEAAMRSAKTVRKQPSKRDTVRYESLASNIAKRYKTKARIETGTRGGKIVFVFRDDEDLKRLTDELL